MKSKTLPLAMVIAVIGCGLAIYANMNSADFKNMLDQERSKRFAAEQQLLKAQQKISVLQAELGSAKSKMSSIEKILTDGHAVQEELQSELDRARQEQEALKKQAQEAEAKATAAQEAAAQAAQGVREGMSQ